MAGFREEGLAVESLGESAGEPVNECVMALAAEAVVLAALGRKESRGAHQRIDFVKTEPDLQRPQIVSLEDDDMISAF